MGVITELPEIFQEFDDARREGFIKVKEIKDTGQAVVGGYARIFLRN